MGYKVKKIYVGTQQVRPIKIIECDFTQSDCGFTNGQAVTEVTTLSRDSSHGFHINETGGPKGYVLMIPSSIYSTQGTLVKVELDCYSTATQNGCGIGYNKDQKRIRSGLGNSLRVSGFSSSNSISVTCPSGGYKLVMDFEELECYLDTDPTNKLTITNSDVSAIRGYFTSGQLNVGIWQSNTGGLSYLQKAIFYIK